MKLLPHHVLQWAASLSAPLHCHAPNFCLPLNSTAAVRPGRSTASASSFFKTQMLNCSLHFPGLFLSILDLMSQTAFLEDSKLSKLFFSTTLRKSSGYIMDRSPYITSNTVIFQSWFIRTATAEKKGKQRKPAVQLPSCQDRTVSLWVRAIKFKGREKEEMHLGGESIQYANHRVEEPRCAATQGTRCIYSPLILHWPPHTVRWTAVGTSSQRWPWVKSLYLRISSRLFVSTVQYIKKRDRIEQWDPGNASLNIGCTAAAKKALLFPLNGDIMHRCLPIDLSWFILSRFSLPGNSITEQNWHQQEKTYY